MPIINKFQIPQETRNKHLREYRRKIQERLAVPGLSDAERGKLRVMLDRLGKPKAYGKPS